MGNSFQTGVHKSFFDNLPTRLALGPPTHASGGVPNRPRP